MVQRAGKEVILVTSGAGALGRRRIRHAMSGSNSSHDLKASSVEEIPIDKRAAAAAGYVSIAQRLALFFPSRHYQPRLIFPSFYPLSDKLLRYPPSLHPLLVSFSR